MIELPASFASAELELAGVGARRFGVNSAALGQSQAAPVPQQPVDPADAWRDFATMANVVMLTLNLLNKG